MWLGHRVQLLMVTPAMFGISSSGMVGKVSRDGGVPAPAACRAAGMRPPATARRRETAR
jgi:hypothetical protein